MLARLTVLMLLAAPLSAQAAMTMAPTRNAPVGSTPEAAVFEHLRVQGTRRTGPIVIHLDPRRLADSMPPIPPEPEGFVDLASVRWLDPAATPPFPAFPSGGVVRPTMAQVTACLANPAPCGPSRAPGAYLLIAMGVPRGTGDTLWVSALTYHHELANPNDREAVWGTATIWWRFRLARGPSGWAVNRTEQRGGLPGIMYIRTPR